MNSLTHFDADGASRMVDVSDKVVTERFARASCQVVMRSETLALIRNRELSKGDVLEVARLAGIMAAKRTDELIPLCHSVPLSSVGVDFQVKPPDVIQIEAFVKTSARTGVEMEALVAVSVAALTLYDMCKSVDRGMLVGPTQLEEKSGGRSGHFTRATDKGPA